MRKTPKERRMQFVQAQRITMVEAAIAVKAQPAKTFSAQMPAYTYTSLCPDPALCVARVAPGLRQRRKLQLGA